MFIVVNINYKTFRNYTKMPSCDFNNFDNCTCRDCSRYESDPDHCLICGVEFYEELMKKRINSYVYYCEECQIIKENKKKEREEKQKRESYKMVPK